MAVRVLHGDCRAVLPTLPAESVQCCVTSPPYFSLRAYLPGDHPDCDLEIGQEPDYLAWVDGLVRVFREVRRVLKPNGTLWLNLGDCYAGSQGAAGRQGVYGQMQSRSVSYARQIAKEKLRKAARPVSMFPGLKNKDLVGLPWRVAFALQADGWWLRRDIIWDKPSPMPESARDRPTTAHEYIFLLTKAESYFYDADAIAESAITAGRSIKMADGWDASTGQGGHGSIHRDGRSKGRKVAAVQKDTRNARSVWRIASQPFTEAHFATFPPEIARRCIKAGSRTGDMVLDPFGGAGTTGLVADQLGRDATLIELSRDYCDLARSRIKREAPLLTEVA